MKILRKGFGDKGESQLMKNINTQALWYDFSVRQIHGHITACFEWGMVGGGRELFRGMRKFKHNVNCCTVVMKVKLYEGGSQSLIIKS